jgi:hypothetical protein
MYIDQLTDIFFADLNWQYYLVEPQNFHELLEQWTNIPFRLLSSRGPEALAPDLKVFPALLFQIIATALLVLPKSLHESFESLKYAANMTFEDLAIDYSESSMSILNLLGTKSLCTTSIQTGFLRSSFLKYTANVTESVGACLTGILSYSMGRFGLTLHGFSGTKLVKRSETRKSWACTEIHLTQSRNRTM